MKSCKFSVVFFLLPPNKEIPWEEYIYSSGVQKQWQMQPIFFIWSELVRWDLYQVLMLDVMTSLVDTDDYTQLYLPKP